MTSDPWASEARDKGMKSAQDRRGAAWDIAVIDQALAELARLGTPFSSADLRDLLGVVDFNLLGVRIMVAARRGQIERAGSTFTRHGEGHGRRVSLWVGTGKPGDQDRTSRRREVSSPRPGRCSNGYPIAADSSCCPEHEHAGPMP